MNTQLVEKRVKNRIFGKGEGWVFTPSSFLDFGGDEAIRKALSRLEEKGMIRRISWGLYDYPRHHKVLGILPPSVDLVAKVISERDKIRLQPSGAYAANLIGLSEQVPAKIVFLTDGNPKKIKLQKTEIIFKKAAPKIMASAGTPAGHLIQALRYTGKDHLTEDIIIRVKNYLKSWNDKELKKFYALSPAWMKKFIQKIWGESNG